MATEKQNNANRLNGQKGGPQTEAGKMAGRLNAVSHGLLSKEVLLPGENSRQLFDLSRHFFEELKPVGELETLLVDRVISSSWRLRRAVQNEKKHNKPGTDYASTRWENYMRYETALERQIYRALKELKALQSTRLNNLLSIASAIDESDPKAQSNQPALDRVSAELAAFYASHPDLIENETLVTQSLSQARLLV